jgi:organic radical activating enzyme
MIVEWEAVLDCNYKCHYCSNGRNDLLDKPIRYEKDMDKIRAFLDNIKEQWPDEEVFVFGGEPLLHPHIEKIVEYFNKIDLKFILQTNFVLTNKIRRMEKMGLDFMVQVSLHPLEVTDEQTLYNDLKELEHKVRRIDCMYIGEPSMQMYKNVLPYIKDKSKLFLAPVADFELDNVVNEYLYKFNKIKDDRLLSKVYNFEPGNRSYEWENMMRGKTTTKGKPCLYTGKYILYDPALQSYTCNMRENNEICPHEQCFLM